MPGGIALAAYASAGATKALIDWLGPGMLFRVFTGLYDLDIMTALAQRAVTAARRSDSFKHGICHRIRVKGGRAKTLLEPAK